jgi:NADH:ubiquinone oxidoreductase subunit 3 (subunit A)
VCRSVLLQFFTFLVHVVLQAEKEEAKLAAFEAGEAPTLRK